MENKNTQDIQIVRFIGRILLYVGSAYGLLQAWTNVIPINLGMTYLLTAIYLVLLARSLK